MSKKNQEQPKAAGAPKVEQPTADQPKQLDSQAFSYEPGTKIEMDAEVFEIFRAYMREQAQRNPPVKYFAHQKPVIKKVKDEKGKTVQVVELVDIETDEEYKTQKPVEFRDVDSFNIVYVNNLLENTHVQNIESGRAVSIEALRMKAQEKQESRLKKVDE